MTNVAVIGAGLMGHNLAVAFAMGGCSVVLHDVSLDALIRAKRLIASSLDVLEEAGLCDRLKKTEITERLITYTTELSKVAGSEVVIEAIPENKDVKRTLYSELHAVLPEDTIIASNTSFLNIFELLPPERQQHAVIAHWYSPPHILDLVEIVPGPETSASTVQRMKDLLEALGKKPIVLPRFISGFIGNRLQAALNLEVYFLLDSGYATPEAIDAAVKHGLALRMPFLGHLMKADFAGLELVQRSLANRTYTPPAVRGYSDALDELVRSGHTGVMAGRGFYDYGDRSPEELFRERDRRILAFKKLANELGEIA